MPTSASNDQLISRFVASHEGATTTKHKFRTVLQEFAVFHDGPILEARRPDLLAYMDHLKDEGRRAWIVEQQRAGRLPAGDHIRHAGALSPSTRKGHLAALRGFWRWANLRELTDRDPTIGIPTPKVETRRGLTLDREELRRFLDAPGRPRDRIQAYLLVFTAARMNELRMLRWGDVDFVEQELHLRGKGGKDRVIHIHDVLARELRRWRDIQRAAGVSHKGIARALEFEETAFVLLTRTGRPLAATTMGRMAKWRAARAGIRTHAPTAAVGAENTSQLHCHALRRSWATLRLNDGVPIDAVADALGHEGVETCRRHYAFAGDERRRRSFDSFRV